MSVHEYKYAAKNDARHRRIEGEKQKKQCSITDDERNREIKGTVRERKAIGKQSGSAKLA